jgi:hypothetical protein
MALNLSLLKPQKLLDRAANRRKLEDPRRTRSQQQAAFLRLPYELREQIYGYVLTGTRLHILTRRSGLVSARCFSPVDHLRPRRYCTKYGYWRRDGSEGLITLLLTCRRM